MTVGLVFYWRHPIEHFVGELLMLLLGATDECRKQKNKK
jgi:hypothetical protein